jgi:predicted protein tyrosine phosphatase
VLDLHFVTPGLAIGAAYPEHAAVRLAADHGISRVVDVRGEDRDDEAVLRLHGIQLLHLPTEDTRAVSQEMLRDGAAFISAGLDAGERVLVHCQYGIGRSALVALCALVFRGVPPLTALEAAKRARPVISPSPDQLHAFRRFAAQIRAERDVGWEVPSLVALGEIAWRHLRRGGAAPSDEAAQAGSTRG